MWEGERGRSTGTLWSELAKEIKEDQLYLLFHDGEGISQTGLIISNSDGETDNEEEPDTAKRQGD